MFVRLQWPNGVAIELPDEFAGARLKAVKHAVTAREDHLRLAGDNRQARVRPLAFDNVLTGQRILPGELARFLVDRDEARRLGRREAPLFVGPVAGADD